MRLIGGLGCDLFRLWFLGLRRLCEVMMMMMMMVEPCIRIRVGCSCVVSVSRRPVCPETSLFRAGYVLRCKC